MPHYRKLKIKRNNLASLQELEYVVGGLDKISRNRGVFAYDSTLYECGAGLFAISPVFDSMDSFLYWARIQGFTVHSLRKPYCVCRPIPVA